MPDVCLGTTFVLDAHGVRKRVSDHLELVMSYHVDSGIQIHVLWKNSVFNY